MNSILLLSFLACTEEINLWASVFDASGPLTIQVDTLRQSFVAGAPGERECRIVEVPFMGLDSWSLPLGTYQVGESWGVAVVTHPDGQSCEVTQGSSDCGEDTPPNIFDDNDEDVKAGINCVDVGPTPPAVVSHDPQAGATDVPLDANVAVHFSEAVEEVSALGAISLREGSAKVDGFVSYDPATHSVVFEPTLPLTAGTTYEAVVSTSLQDLDGDSLASELTWAFTTVPLATHPDPNTLGTVDPPWFPTADGIYPELTLASGEAVFGGVAYLTEGHEIEFEVLDSDFSDPRNTCTDCSSLLQITPAERPDEAYSHGAVFHVAKVDAVFGTWTLRARIVDAAGANVEGFDDMTVRTDPAAFRVELGPVQGDASMSLWGAIPGAAAKGTVAGCKEGQFAWEVEDADGSVQARCIDLASLSSDGSTPWDVVGLPAGLATVTLTYEDATGSRSFTQRWLE